MFWIHGGADVTGQAATYGGGALATTQRVIVVSANYRLGVLGWFRHAALRAATTDADERSGNFGTLDLIRALEWVRDNICCLWRGSRPHHAIRRIRWRQQRVFTARLVASRRVVPSRDRSSGTPETFGVDEAENLTDDVAPGAEKSSSEMLLRLLIQDGSASSDAIRPRLALRRCHSRAWRAICAASHLQISIAPICSWKRTSSDPAASLLALSMRLPRRHCIAQSDGIMAALGRKDGHNNFPVILGTTRDEFTVLLPLISGSLLAETTGAGFGFRIKDKARYALIAEYLSRLLKAYAVDEPAIAIRRHSPDSVYVFRFDWDEFCLPHHGSTASRRRQPTASTYRSYSVISTWVRNSFSCP